MTRLNPTYENFKTILAEHFDELNSADNTIRFKNRLVSVVKIEMVIAKDAATGEDRKGFFYLCKDHQSNASKADHLMSSKSARKMKTSELMEACERFGIFAIVTTKDLSREDVLPEYYVRQDIEQYFDYDDYLYMQTGRDFRDLICPYLRGGDDKKPAEPAGCTVYRDPKGACTV